MWSKRIAQGIVAFLVGFQGVAMNCAAAASPFSAVVDHASVFQGGSFVVLLNADLGSEVLLSLDPVVEFDPTRLSFGGYEIEGTLTADFFVYDLLSDQAVSLLQTGNLSLPAVQTALRARFHVLPQATEGLTSVRLYGFAGIDSLSQPDVAFDFSPQVLVTVVPEPSLWLMLVIGLGAIGVRRVRKMRSPESVRDESSNVPVYEDTRDEAASCTLYARES